MQQPGLGQQRLGGDVQRRSSDLDDAHRWLVQATFDLAQVRVRQPGLLGQLAQREIGQLPPSADEFARRFHLGVPRFVHAGSSPPAAAVLSGAVLSGAVLSGGVLSGRRRLGGTVWGAPSGACRLVTSCCLGGPDAADGSSVSRARGPSGFVRPGRACYLAAGLEPDFLVLGLRPVALAPLCWPVALTCAPLPCSAPSCSGLPCSGLPCSGLPCS